MILFKEDWNKYPDSIVDTKTPNESFIRLAGLYKAMGIENHAFILQLHNPSLQGIDPHSPNLSTEQIIAITKECRDNPFYFFREVVRVPASGFADPIPFIASRGNIALYWLFFNHITVYLEQIRQTGKSVGCDCLNAYILNVGGISTKIQLLTKDDSLRVANVKRIKEIMDGLPPYLNLRSKKDTNNTENITVQRLGNELVTAVGQPSPKSAMNIGRGMTSPILFIDEFNFISNIDITMSGLLPATTAARENAKKAGGFYGNVYTSTAGYLSTRSGKFGYSVYQSGFRWTEKLFDTKNLEEAEDLILKNSKSKAPLVIAEFNHRQLGKTDEWLKRVIAESMVKGENAAAEFLNRWSHGSEESPLPKERIEEMNRSIINDPYVEISNYGYITHWYLDEDYVRSGMEDRTFVLGLDTSDAIGTDSISMVIRDVRTGEVVAAGEYNETNIITFSEWLADFLLRYPNITLIPERRSSGASILDNIVKIFCLNGVNPFKRIFNWTINEITKIKDDSEEYRLAMSNNISSRDVETIAKYKKKFGYATSGAGATSRDNLYGSALTASVRYTSTSVRDKRLFDQLTGLVVKNGRIDHKAGGHDDLCFIGSMLVRTDKGNIPIKKLKLGDMILTREGYKPLIAICKRKANVITKYGITGTPDHPFITPNGIIKFKDLTDETKVYIWKEKLLSTTEKNITGIPTLQEDILGHIFGSMINGKNHQLPYIGKFILITMDRFLKVTTYIISMVTLLTTRSLIWNVFQRQNTESNIQLVKKPKRNLGRLLKNKITWADGDKRTLKEQEKSQERMDQKATVLKNGEKKTLSLLKKFILKPLRKLDLMIKRERKKKYVYNLTVADCHEYFVNDILVHNCIGWLLAYWFLTKAENLKYYGINPNEILSDVTKEDKKDKTPEEYEQDEYNTLLKNEIKHLLDELENTTNIYHQHSIESRIRFLHSQITDETYNSTFNIDSLIDKIKETRLRNQQQYYMR